MFRSLLRSPLKELTVTSGVAEGGPPLPVAPVNIEAPVVSGDVTVGATLSTSVGGWEGDPPITYTYQWLANGSNISGATSSTYTTVEEGGTSISCRVTATNSAGSSSAVSNAVVLVSPVIEPTAPALGRLIASVGGTWPSTSGRAIASKATLSEDASTIAYWQYLGGGGGAMAAGRTWVGLIYSDDEGEPGDLLYSSDVGVTGAEEGWHYSPLEATLPAGDYWLATLISDFGVTINSATVANGGAAGNIRRGEGIGTPASPADPWPGSAATGDGTLSACVTYTA